MRLPTSMTRRFVLGATLALMLGGILVPSKSVSSNASCTPYEKEITYYNDAAHSQVVGTGHIYCNGRGTLEGTSSPYHDEEILNVCCAWYNGCVPC
jgi:hypothetical protein